MTFRRAVLVTWLILSVFFVFGVSHNARPLDDESPDGRFTEHEYLGHLEFLAHDLLEGRATGDRGAALAAAYIAAQFKAMGLQPYSAEHGYLQPVKMTGYKTDYETLKFGLFGKDGEHVILPLQELVVNSELTQTEISLDDDLLFIGYGIEAPEYKWDDFKGLDLEGKLLVALVNDPDYSQTKFGSESMTYYGRWAYKLEMARRKKAKGIILIHHDREATYNWSVVRNSWSVERLLFSVQKDPPLLLQSWMSHTVFDRALKASGLDYAALKKMADKRKFKPMSLPLRLKGRFQQTVRQADCSNVIGMIPGTDPRLKDEFVIYTAHFDHFGIGLPDERGDRIYNGALDNASGTAALICLARAFVTAPVKPKRTVIIMPVTGEELGLLGSTWFVENPPLDLDRIAMVINKDCMNHFGRRDSFSAFPIEYCSALNDVTKIGAARGLKLLIRSIDTSGGSFRSDHFPFAGRGIPAMSVGMSGAYLDRSEEEVKAARNQIGYSYHQPNDEMHSAWIYDGVIQELDLLYTFGRYWADGAEKPVLTIDKDNPYRATQLWYGIKPGGK